jgi:nucleoside-diphosphate-sugar epimerase
MHDYSIKELAMTIKEFIPETEIEITEARRVDAKKGELDTAKAKKILGYEAEYDLKSGVKETIKWFLDVYCPVFELEPKKEVAL